VHYKTKKAIILTLEIEKKFMVTFFCSKETMKRLFRGSRFYLSGFPREAIKRAFQNQILSEGELWLDMLGKRNLLAHTYDEDSSASLRINKTR
jgi:nucleotidyltransferase substrate binding protein (TIGR01987 family)